MTATPGTVGPEARFHYVAYGLELASEVEIPGLRNCDASVPSYMIQFRPVSRSLDGPATPETGFAVRHDATRCRIRFADGTAVDIDALERIVSIEPLEDATIEDAAGYLAGPVAAILARLEGHACFHGAVVVIDEEAHVLCGPSESGKSTTAAAFAREKLDVMSDDVCAIDASGNDLQVLSATPRIQLWPDGAAMVYGRDHGLPAISPPWPKLYLDLQETRRFRAEPARLGGVWIFAPGIDTVQPLTGASCLTSLVAHAYLPVYSTPDMRRHTFEVATTISRTTPVRLLSSSLDPGGRVETIVREHRKERG